MQSSYYLVAIWLLVSTANAYFPPDVERCKPEDNKCMAKVATSIIQSHPGGREDIGLPKIDPYHINSFTVGTNSGGGVALKIIFSDIDAYGLSKGIVDKIEGFSLDPETSKFEGSAVFPAIKLKGKYEADGQILILPIQGKGDADLTLENCRISVKFKPTIIKKDGKTYLDVNKLKALTEPSKLIIRLENLFNGDPTLGNNMNTFLNENSKEVWDEVSVSVNKAIEGIFGDILKQFFKNVTYEEILLND